MGKLIWRKRIKIAPGITLNLSPYSTGVTVGNRLARVTANTRRGITSSVSLPGTGLRYQHAQKIDAAPKAPAPPNALAAQQPVALAASAPPKRRGGGLLLAALSVVALWGILVLASGGTETADPEARRSTGAQAVLALPTRLTPPVAPAAEAPALVFPTVTSILQVVPKAPDTPTPQPTPAPMALIATQGAVNVRSGPGQDYAIVTTANAGESFAVLGQSQQGLWILLEIRGAPGWVYSELLDLRRISAAIPVNASLNEQALKPIATADLYAACYAQVDQRLAAGASVLLADYGITAAAENLPGDVEALRQDGYRLCRNELSSEAFAAKWSAPPAPPTLAPEPVPATRVEVVPLPIVPQEQPAAPARSCCKVCTGSKACGDSCISRSKTCHKGDGCACQG